MKDTPPLVLFDGICNFCDFWVHFAIRHDRRKRLKFAPLQGETAARLLANTGIDPEKNDTVLFLTNGHVYAQSSAALRICGQLDGGWKLLAVFLAVPGFIRNPVYRWIARNRYRWYGKKETCLVPTPELRERFLP